MQAQHGFGGRINGRTERDLVADIKLINQDCMEAMASMKDKEEWNENWLQKLLRLPQASAIM